MSPKKFLKALVFRPNDLVKLEVDINNTTANPLAQIVHRSRALEFAKNPGESLGSKEVCLGTIDN